MSIPENTFALSRSILPCLVTLLQSNDSRPAQSLRQNGNANPVGEFAISLIILSGGKTWKLRQNERAFSEWRKT